MGKEHDFTRKKENEGDHYSEKGSHKERSNFWKMIRREKRVIVRQRIERSQNEG